MAVGRWILCSAILFLSLDISCLNNDYSTLECGRNVPLNCETVSLFFFHGTHLNPYGFAWNFRHRGSRGKRYLSARASLYANRDVSFSLTRVARSGDVAINPGPDIASTASSESLKLKCPICRRTVASNHRALICDSCNRWTHIRCGQVTAKRYAQLQQLEEFKWHCPECSSVSHVSTPTDDVGHNVNFGLSNSTSSGITETLEAEDIHHYSLLARDISVDKGCLKIGHINVNGLLTICKLQELNVLLDSLHFDVLGVTESKLASNNSDSDIDITGDTSFCVKIEW